MDRQTYEALLAKWDKQLASLSDLAMDIGVTPRGKIGSYDATRRFADALNSVQFAGRRRGLFQARHGRGTGVSLDGL